MEILYFINGAFAVIGILSILILCYQFYEEIKFKNKREKEMERKHLIIDIADEVDSRIKNIFVTNKRDY